MEERKTVKIASKATQEEADKIVTQLSNLGLKVKRQLCLELLALEERSTQKTTDSCPVCRTHLNTPLPATCPTCQFSLKNNSAHAIRIHRIKWEERMSMKAGRDYDEKRAREEARKREEDALRRKIRKELEKEMYRRAWWNKQYVKAGLGGSALLLTGALFAGGFYLGSLNANQNNEQNLTDATTATSPAPIMVAANSNIDPMDLIENLATVANAGANGATIDEDSLVSVSNQMGAQIQKAPELPEQNYMTTNDNTIYRLPENTNWKLVPEYVDFLLTIDQISRAKEVAQQLSKNKNADPSVLTRMNAHISAKLLAKTGSKSEEKQLQEYIKHLLSAEDKIAVLMYAAKAGAVRKEISENFLSMAEEQLKNIKDNDTQKQFNEQITLTRAEVLSTRASRYAQKGLFGKAKQTVSELQNIINTQWNSNTTAAIHIIAYPVYGLVQNQEMLQTAQEKIKELNRANISKAESDQILTAWKAHAFELNPELNRHLIQQVFMPQDSSKLPADESSLTLLRICNELNFKQEASRLLLQGIELPQSEEERKNFYAKMYIYKKMDTAEAEYKNDKLFDLEKDVRELAGMLLHQ